jgi:hypothetical protein
MGTSSTLKFIGNSLTTFLPGTVEFLAGSTGMSIDAKAKVHTRDNVDTIFTNDDNPSDKLIDITANGTFELVLIKGAKAGSCITLLPVQNAGHLFVRSQIKWTVYGHVGGGNGPTLSQTGGWTWFETGSTITARFGTEAAPAPGRMSVTGGKLRIMVRGENEAATLVGNFELAGETGKLFFEAYGVPDLPRRPGQFKVDGDVTWGGTSQYVPNMWSAVNGKCDLWWATGTFTVGANVDLTPSAPSTQAGQETWRWKFVEGKKGITGNPPALQQFLQADWQLEAAADGDRTWWHLRRKPA